jgi:hypothetical protein
MILIPDLIIDLIPTPMRPRGLYMDFEPDVFPDSTPGHPSAPELIIDIAPGLTSYLIIDRFIDLSLDTVDSVHNRFHLSTPSLGADLISELIPDLIIDLIPDLTPNPTPDLILDLILDLIPDRSPDLSPDPNPDPSRDLFQDLIRHGLHRPIDPGPNPRICRQS